MKQDHIYIFYMIIWHNASLITTIHCLKYLNRRINCWLIFIPSWVNYYWMESLKFRSRGKWWIFTVWGSKLKYLFSSKRIKFIILILGGKPKHKSSLEPEVPVYSTEQTFIFHLWKWKVRYLNTTVNGNGNGNRLSAEHQSMNNKR